MAGKKYQDSAGRWRDARGKFTSAPKKPSRKAPPKKAPPKKAPPKKAPPKKAPPKKAPPKKAPPKKAPPKKAPSRKRAPITANVPPPGAVYADSRGRWRDSRGRFLSTTPAKPPRSSDTPWDAARKVRARLIAKGVDPDLIRVFQVGALGRRRMTITAFQRFMTQDKYQKARANVAEAAEDAEKDERDIWAVGIMNEKTGDVERIVWEFDPENFVDFEE